MLVGLMVVIGPDLHRQWSGGGSPGASVATIPPAWAPRELTSVMEPMIVWDNAPDQDQRYDVWILPADGAGSFGNHEVVKTIAPETVYTRGRL